MDDQEEQDLPVADEEGIPDSFKACKLFRKLAKRILALAEQPTDDEEIEDQLNRTELIEDLWFVGSEIDVWVHGIGESLGMALVCLYSAQDDEALVILNHLADEELGRLRALGEEAEGDASGG